MNGQNEQAKEQGPEFKDKITSVEYLAWRSRYYLNPNKTLRLGQAFLNEFFPNLVHPKLFYTKDVSEAEAIIYEMYIV